MRWKGHVHAEIERKFSSKASAEAWAARTKARLEASNAVADNDIWTSVELIYETRWDCPTARLATAHFNPSTIWRF